MEELTAASKSLRSSIARYVNACNAAREAHDTLSVVGHDSHALLDRVTRELRAFPNYETDMQSAKLTLARCRNSSHYNVRIHALPPEVLARVFEFVCFASTEFKYSTHAETLLNVCTHWRQIALNWPVLWSHIHVTTSYIQGSKFAKILDRCKSFASRSGSLGTDLRIDVLFDVVPQDLPNIALLGQVYSRAKRKLRTLSLYNWANADRFCDVVRSFLSYPMPSSLKQLIILDHPFERKGVAVLDDPTTRLMGKHLRSVKTLRLLGFSHPWPRFTYSGLCDLRFVADRRYPVPSISIPQLRTILSNSPGLRIFYFNYQIKFGEGSSHVTTPVHLNELQELNICGMLDSPDELLRLLSPGSRLLSLSISVRRDMDFTGCNPITPAVLKFLEQSGVSELHIEYFTKFETFPLSCLLDQPLARVRVVGLRGFTLDQRPDPLTNPGRRSLSTRLDILRLENCFIDSEVLRDFLDIRAIRTLNVCGGSLINGQEVSALIGAFPGVMVSCPPERREVGDREYWDLQRSRTIRVHRIECLRR